MYFPKIFSFRCETSPSLPPARATCALVLGGAEVPVLTGFFAAVAIRHFDSRFPASGLANLADRIPADGLAMTPTSRKPMPNLSTHLAGAAFHVRHEANPTGHFT